jgi:hypothetical protein
LVPIFDGNEPGGVSVGESPADAILRTKRDARTSGFVGERQRDPMIGFRPKQTPPESPGALFAITLGDYS